MPSGKCFFPVHELNKLNITLEVLIGVFCTISQSIGHLLIHNLNIILLLQTRHNANCAFVFTCNLIV